MTSANSNEPESFLDETEVVDCAACGRSSDDAVVAGTKARFDMPLRNVACRRCSLVYVSPRPTERALEEYYRTQYRSHYHGVKIPSPDGGFVGPGDEGFDDVWTERHRSQAQRALQLGEPPKGGRVLEVGCGDASALRFVAELGEVEVFGIEPDEREAAIANERGVPCFNGTMESYQLEGEGFDQVQMFHVLEHLRHPLDALVQLASYLRPGGKLVIEVPNVHQPYGALEENFFQNAHIYNFSASTLSVLFQRAGLRVERTFDGPALCMVGVPDESIDRGALPLPFDPAMNPACEQDGAWIAERLATYAELEKLRLATLQGKLTMDRLERLCQVLQQPSFEHHLMDVIGTVVPHLLEQQAFRIGMVLLRSAAAGPHRPYIRESFATSAAQLNAKLEELAA